MWAILTSHAALARLQARTVLQHRVDYFVGIGRLLLQIFLLRIVWTALYAGQPNVGGVTLSMTIAYITLANIQNWLFNPWVFSLIPERVREGRVGVDLTRPVGFIGQVVACQVGRTAAIAPFVALTLPFAILIAGARLPPSVGAAVSYIFSLVLAYGVATLLSVLCGLISFWTLETSGLFLIYRIVQQFLSGVLVPLWFMPHELLAIARLLPFQAVTYTPTAIYLGRIHGIGAIAAMAVQVGWIVLLCLTARLVWSRAVRRIVVHGG
jgi:ABC-2 type transport system permease protein